MPGCRGGPRLSAIATSAGTVAGNAGTLHHAVAAYLDHLGVERGLAANTLASYRRDLSRYARFLLARGVTAVDKIGPQDIGDFLIRLREGDPDHPPLSASSAARTVVAVRGFHRFALREGFCAADPAKEVRPPTPPRRLPKALPLADVEAILHAAGADQTPRALRDRALLELLYATGARISEAVGLDVDDLEPVAGAVRNGERLEDGDSGGDLAGDSGWEVAGGTVLLRGKGGKQRIVPVGSYALDAVSAYRVRGRPALASAGRGTPALFLNARGGRLSRQSAWTVLRNAAERAKVTVEVSPHTLRHSFATHLLDGGADVRVVQELLGHASVTTTQVYTLVTVDKLREVYAASHPRARG